MPRVHSAFAIILLAVLSSSACQSSDPSPVQPEGRLVVEPIQIDSIELFAAGSAAYSVHVKGIVGDGCSELLPLQQVRQGTDIVVTIQRQRPENAICTQIARLFDQVIPLEGAFPSGQYTVRINSTTLTFTVP
jgi:hypothetical protein